MRILTTLIAVLTITFTASAQYYYSYVDSAEVYIKEEKWEAAEKAIVNALRTDPANYNNSLLISNLATIQRIEGKNSEALNNYSLALEMTPNAVTLLNNRGSLYLDMDSIDSAKRDFEKVMRLDENDITSRFYYSLMLIDEGKLDSSKALLGEIRKLNPKSTEYKEGMAKWYDATGNYKAAAEQYSELLKDNNAVEWLICRAECYIDCNEYLLAKEDIAEALKISPTDGYLYLLKAKINKYQFQNSEMLKNLEIAVRYGVSKEEANALINYK